MKYLLPIFIVFNLLACTTSRQTSSYLPVRSDIPAIEREFRAAWVASVANINWPSKAGLTVDEQKKEAIEMLDFLQENHFNAIILQVRPQCDALYASELEPWSYYLTGTQGKAPEPYYDPLEFWIEEAHKRAIELHAWLNPYRAHHSAGGPVSDQSIVKTKSELVVKLENGYYWMDPSDPGTQDHSYQVVMDIVNRYDVDGIHFDDYFYPYPSYNKDKDFPDEKNWNKYKEEGGKLSRNDWRREAVNQFIERLYTGIKQTKKHVKFGLSPFGIWRPNHPPSIKGFDQYDQLYADAKLWLNKGWIDYFTPQLYWPINKIPQSFPVLLSWWVKQNHQNRHLWPGISTGRLNNIPPGDEVINQIMIARAMLPESPGIVHWNLGSFQRSESLTRAVVAGPYNKAALIPASTWLDSLSPGRPAFKTSIGSDSVFVEWDLPRQTVKNYVLYSQYASSWEYRILPGSLDSASIPVYTLHEQEIQGLNKLALSAIDLFGNESEVDILDVSGEVAAVLAKTGSEKPTLKRNDPQNQAIQPIFLPDSIQDLDLALTEISEANYNTIIVELREANGLDLLIEKAHKKKLHVFGSIKEASYLERSLTLDLDGLMFRDFVPSKSKLVKLLLIKPALLFSSTIPSDKPEILKLYKEKYLDVLFDTLPVYIEGEAVDPLEEAYPYPKIPKKISPRQIVGLDLSPFLEIYPDIKEIQVNKQSLSLDKDHWAYFIIPKTDSIFLVIASEKIQLPTGDWSIPFNYQLLRDGSVKRVGAWLELRKFPAAVTSKSSFDLLAKSKPSASAFINGKKVKVYKTGVYFDRLTFAEGVNKIRTRVTLPDGDSSYYELAVYYDPSHDQPTVFPLWMDKNSFSPRADLVVQPGEEIHIEFEGSRGQEALVELVPSGKQYVCSRTDREQSSIYQVSITTDPFMKEGRFDLLVKMNGNTLFPTGKTLSIRKASNFPYVKITKNNARLLYNLGKVRLGGPILSTLQKGVVLKTMGSYGDYFEVQLNSHERGMISKEAVEVLPLSFQQAPYFITNIQAAPGSGEEIVSIPYLNPAPYQIIPEPSQNRIVIRIFGAKTSSTWISHRANLSLIDKVSWRQSDPTTYEVLVHLKQDKIWGYELVQKDKVLQLKIKHSPEFTPSKRKPFEGLTIALEAGHGGKSTGAIGLSGTKEKDINLFLALELERLLRQKGARVIQVRPDDRDMSLLEKREIVENSGANLFVSIHANAAGGGYLRVSGTSTYYHNDFWAPFAEKVYDRLLETGLPEFGVVGSFNYTPIITSKLPAILVEQAFMSHAEDEEKMTDPEFRTRMAEKIVLGIFDYFQYMHEK